MSEINVVGLRFAYADDIERLKGIDLDVETGEVLVIDGPSGSGKSTLLRALCGLVPHFHGGTIDGTIEVAGTHPITDRPRVVAGQVGYLFQDPEAQIVFDTVGMDVAFGPRAAGWSSTAIEEAVNLALEACGIAHLANRQTASLSGGELQRVALAGILARTPRVLLLDEPSAQLDNEGISGLVDVLGELGERHRTTMVIADHHPEHFAPLSPRRLTMRSGRMTSPDERAKQQVLNGFAQVGGVVVEGRGLTCRRGGRTVLRDHDFVARAGEITLISGRNGAGKSTLLRTLMGLESPDEGQVILHGKSVTNEPADCRFPRIALVANSSRNQMLTETVADEIAFGLIRMGVAAKERALRVTGVARELELEDLLERHPLDLSVGQREQVALAAALVARPGVLLLDEPTRALDRRRSDRLARVLRRTAETGSAVIVASHDEQFAGALADQRVTLSALTQATEAIGA